MDESQQQQQQQRLQLQRDQRVEELWRKLDPTGHGELDFKALKDADQMLRALIGMVDTNDDGKIQYEEFRVFVEAAEQQLLMLFQSIDRNKDGRLNKDELQKAFHQAGLSVPKARLSGFFEEIDMNRDGYITFDEWRDFLLFMPSTHNGSPLADALSFYSSIVTVNPEGDSLVSDDTLEGLGYFLAGAVSGGVSRTATAPLDRLKVYLLVNTQQHSGSAIFAAKSGQPLAALRNAGGPIVEAIVTLWKTGGLRTFFAGNGLNVVKIMPESAIRFGSYEASKRFLASWEGHDDPTRISTVSKFVAGGIGGMTAQFCVYPIDTLKFRLQCETVQGGPKGSVLLLRTAQKMWADGGLRAAYRGLGLGLVGMFPYSAIDIGTFEFLKKSYTRAMAKYYEADEEDVHSGNVATAVLGATSGALGATVVYPLNVLRTRLQTQGTAMHRPTYTGIVDVATRTIKLEIMPHSDNLHSVPDDEPDMDVVGDTANPAQPRAQGFDLTTSQAMDDNAAPGPSARRDVVDISDQDQHILSPTDGYFGGQTSSQVPYVPNVLVEDPSMNRSAAEGKAREAEQERLRNTHPSTADSSSSSRVAAGVETRPSTSSTTASTCWVAAASPSSSSPPPQPASATARSVPPHVPYQARTPGYHGELFPPYPLGLPREAPPAYTPSPAFPSSSSSAHPVLGNHSSTAYHPPAPPSSHLPAGNYQTFSAHTAQPTASAAMGRPSYEGQPLLGSYPQPQSMRDRGAGDGHDDGVRAMPAERRRLRSCTVLVTGLALLVLAAGSFMNLIGLGGNMPGHINHPPIDGHFAWDPRLSCRTTTITRETETFTVDLGDDKKLAIFERSNDDGEYHPRPVAEVHVQGAILFRRAGPDTPSSALTVEVAVTDERLVVSTDWDREQGILKVTVPHHAEWRDRDFPPRECVNVKITAWVPGDSSLASLAADAVHLDVKLLNNLSLSVREKTSLASIVGTVASASTGDATRDTRLIDAGWTDSGSPIPPAFRFSSPVIDGHTISGPIVGIWPMFDALGLQTTSGNIRVAVAPREADKDNTDNAGGDDNPSTINRHLRPSTLRVHTQSGDINLREPIGTTSNIPARDYRIDVGTTSGTVTVGAAFGSVADFKSTSGKLKLELLPVLDKALLAEAEPQSNPAAHDQQLEEPPQQQHHQAILSTSSTSGGTDVHVFEPLWVTNPSTTTTTTTSSSPSQPNPPLRHLSTTHTTTSSKITLRLPTSWEGDIDLSSLSGKLHAGGKDVEIIKSGKEWPGVRRVLVARKGERRGGMAVGKSTSGNVEVWVGRSE
ncbi:hypothetical protein VTJ49DRAFT_4437 [Mycothermus thermophilus]|uniref:Mitochondrial thiamine pyrophosphate carrier 1 n=1 Tax=Humicola insolens TaxID=85995 RepID=A0ABR3V7A3_HUMIN